MVLANSKYTIEFVVKVQNSSIGLFYQTRTWYLTNLLCTFIWHHVEMLFHYFFNFLDKYLDFFLFFIFLNLTGCMCPRAYGGSAPVSSFLVKLLYKCEIE